MKQSSTRWLRITLFLMLRKLPFHPLHPLMPRPLSKEGLSPERVCHYKQDANWERSDWSKALMSSILMLSLQRRTCYTKRALELAVRTYLALKTLGEVKIHNVLKSGSQLYFKIYDSRLVFSLLVKHLHCYWVFMESLASTMTVLRISGPLASWHGKCEY